MVAPLVYETAPIGDSAGPFTYVIPEDFNRKRLASYAIADDFFAADPDGRAYAEPSFLCGQHSWVMRRRYSWGGSVHAKCDIALMKPVHLGATIHVTARISGKYQRRGGRYVVFELETTDGGGDLVCRVENTMLLNFRDVAILRRQAAEAAKQPSDTEAPTAATAPGVPALGLSFGPKPLRREDILGFFQAEEDVYGEHASLHNVATIAQAAGLPDIIAPGRYSIGLMNCMFARLYGAGWMSGARYSVSFLQNLLPGIEAQVQATAVRVAAAPDHAAAMDVFTVGCRDNTSGRMVLAGTVSLPRRG